MSSDYRAVGERLVTGEMLRLLLQEMSDLRCELSSFHQDACDRGGDPRVMRRRLRSIDRTMARVRKRIRVIDRLTVSR